MKLNLTRTFAPLALTVVLLGTGASNFAAAQPAPQKASSDLRSRARQHVTALLAAASDKAHELNLTADQKVKLRAIAKQNAPLARAIWNDEALTRDQKLTKLSALRNEARAVLTAEQRKKLASTPIDAMGKAFETAMWVSGELKLSSEQQEKIRGIVMASVAQGRGMNGGTGAIKSLVLDTDGKIEKVLTPEQKVKWGVIRTVAREEVGKKAREWRAQNKTS